MTPSSEQHTPRLNRVTPAATCCDDAWEAAYLRFETPAETVRKVKARLSRLGAASWPRDARIVDLFYGRGSGLVALEELGFTRIEGVDLSASLLAQYSGRASVHVCDCRQLPFPDASCDIAIVQGGLHHLARIPEDVEQVVAEVRRILVPGGRFVVVEPWRTHFLSFVHLLCGWNLARWSWPRLDALAVMIHHERATYERWLSQGAILLSLFDRCFQKEQCHIGWGKLLYVGSKVAGPCPPKG